MSAHAQRLRLPLDAFGAFANAVPGLVLPPGFRPGPAVPGLDDVAPVLGEAGLLLDDGGRVVLCPALCGLLRLFVEPAVRLRLRVHDQTADDGPVRWLTESALAGGRGARLTRAHVPGASAPGRDGGRLEVAGFEVGGLVPQLLGCIPDVARAAPGRPRLLDPVDVAACPSVPGRCRSMWLSVHTASGRAVDTWWDAGDGWWRVGWGAAGRLRFSPVDGDRLAADLLGLLADEVVAPGRHCRA